MNSPSKKETITLKIVSPNEQIMYVLEHLPRNERLDKIPFSREEAEYLAGIRTYSEEYLFDYSDTNNFYQLVSMVLIMRDGEENLTLISDQPINENAPPQTTMDFSQIRDFLNEKEWIFPEETVHESPLIDNIRRTIERIILIQEQEPVVEEGNIVCVRPGCSSRRILRHEQQTHGADESATVFLLCTECGKNWKKD